MRAPAAELPSTLGPRALPINCPLVPQRLPQRDRKVLIADEPTRGVDVGSRRSIYDLIVAQANQGIGVVVISSEVEEVLGLAHRILVVRGGRIVAEFSGDAMTEENILTAAFADPITSEDA